MATSSHQGSQPFTPWRVRFFRRLRYVLRFVWGTLIVSIVVGIIVSLSTATTDTPLSKLNIIRLVLAFPIQVVSSLGVLILLTLLSWIGGREREATEPGTLSEQDRVHMLGRLRLRYKQMLDQSLEGAVQVELGLAARPTAVQNAASLSLRLPDQPEQPLPSHTSIIEAYGLAQQELLILGEPGAGKSTLLLELAHHLVQQAEQDAKQPLPILLPLSSWAVSRRPLQDWLGEQIALLYDVPRRLSQQWLQAEQLLPLLDGLDEMEASSRAACIAAINTYHGEHLRPLVVCSRTNEYDAAAVHKQLALHTAVVVQPLSREQVDTHLANIGKPLAALRAALNKNPLLQTLATTPLLLQVFMLTYYGTSVRELPRKETQLLQQVWTDYVQRMVQRKGDARRYPLDATQTWLGWLAQEMRQHNETIFSLEQLQPDWLLGRRRALYQWSVGLLFGLVVGLGVGLLFGLVGGLVFGLGVGLVFGLVNGLAKKIKPAEAFTWSSERLWYSLVVGLVGGLVFGLVIGHHYGLVVGLVVGLVNGLVVGLLFGFSGKQLTERLMLSPNEGIRRSVNNGLVFGLVVGLVFGLVVGLVGGLVFGLGLGLGAGLGAAVQYYALRFWLWRTHTFPWRAVSFLKDATARILLRRVGGGYSFTHRLLLDHFADLDLVPSSGSTNAQPTE